MKFLVVGAGGTGGCLAGYLAEAGQDVTVVARGAHLDAILRGGLKVRNTRLGDLSVRIHACTAEEYDGCPDVIFVCVKGYSLDEIIPLLKKAAGAQTMIVPVLNIVGTGGRIAAQLPNCVVLDGCIYVSAYISAPGEVTQGGPILRVVYGERGTNAHRPRLEALRDLLCACQIDVLVSDNIAKDTYQKYLFLSPFAASGAYLGATAGTLLGDESSKALFLTLHGELLAIAHAQGFSYDEGITQSCLKLLSAMPAEGTSSMQKDLARGGQSELDGLVCEPIRLGKRYCVPTPTYEKVAERLCRLSEGCANER